MKLKRVLCGVLSLTMISISFFAAPLEASVAREKAEVIGSVNMEGDPDFDSDSIQNDEPSQWRWLGK